MKIIRDTIHGDIFLSDNNVTLIDTLPIQRLRNVAQLGTVEWVFPGATHSRFEHTIGVVHLAKRILRSLVEIKKYREVVDILSAAAVFHDAGHPPFSHSIEEFGILTKKKHEERSIEIAKKTIESSKNMDLSASDVAKVLEKNMGYLSDIIAGTLDADRLDYLNRDAHHTGVSYGVIDSRIISLFTVVEDRLAIDERAVTPAETVLFARYVMRAIVYDHKTARSTAGMIAKAVEYAIGRDDINDDVLDEEEIARMRDLELLLRLKDYKFSKELVEKIEVRNTLKLAGVALRERIERIREAFEMTPEQRHEYENTLADKLGIEPYEILIDKPNIDRYFIPESSIPVSSGDKIVGKLRDLHISKLADPISRQHEYLWAIRLYAPEKLKGKARIKFNKLTGIELGKPGRPPLLKGEFWRLRNIYE
jgi:HD superfamily phosphohydrolase